jgi:hypothetical protein
MEQVNGYLRAQLKLQQRLLTSFESLIMGRLMTSRSEAIVAFHGLVTVVQESHPEAPFKGYVATSLCNEFNAMRHIQWSQMMLTTNGPVPPHIVSSLLAQSTAVENYIDILRNWTERARGLLEQNDVLLPQHTTRSG